MEDETWELMRGDGASREVWLPLEIYTPGGKLYFAAKEEPDADPTDNSAAVKKTMTDDDVTSTSFTDPDEPNDDTVYAVFVCALTAEDTDNAEPNDNYIGEFQYVDVDGTPFTAAQFRVAVKGDINRRRD